ncbi:MAG: redox-regulated ATPase YchF [Candidatus Aegiribacteria sp.]|nr:redox-regulated ATPase YchF [Candidatus Aegiribacteria sp.]
MIIALAGKPGCGRSTLFRALAGSADTDTGKPLTVKVPDHRLDFLESIHDPLKNTNATVVFFDVPTPSFSSKNLSLIRNAAVLTIVLDNYALGDTLNDFNEIESELILNDMALCEKRQARLVKESKGKSREALLLGNLQKHMENGSPLRILDLDKGEAALLAPYALLSLKPLIVVSNRMGEPVTPDEELSSAVSEHGGTLLGIDAGFELELTEIDESEQAPFLESMGYSSSGLSRLIRTSYSTLDLIVFFTIGKDETRAWPIRKGSTALDAAGTIHSDLARGFIRAVVIPWELYHEHPDRTLLKEKGELRIEGRDYTVRDGDIIEIRFNV